jgi:hypothetical protein
MTSICRICNVEIIGRDARAKNCWLCSDSYGTVNGARKAIAAVAKAVKKGILPSVKTLICVDCGKPSECYDHRDYNKPLDVVPVCRKCNFRRGAAIPIKKDVAIQVDFGLR